MLQVPSRGFEVDDKFGGQCEVLSADQPNLANTSVGIKNLSSIECIGFVDR